MLYEHQIKDFQQAKSYTIQGLELLSSTKDLREEQKKKWEISLEKRLQRLENKK